MNKIEMLRRWMKVERSVALALLMAGSACGEIREVFVTGTGDASGSSDPGRSSSEMMDSTGLEASSGARTTTGEVDGDTESEASTALGTGTTGEAPESHCRGDAVVIPDDGVPLEFALEVPGLEGITAVAVGVRISHPRVADLEVQLVGPQGTSALLLATPGCEEANVDAIFDDGAEVVGNERCAEGSSAIDGRVSPLEPLGSLLDGLSDGPWTIVVYDRVPGNAGSLDGGCVILTRPGG